MGRRLALEGGAAVFKARAYERAGRVIAGLSDSDLARRVQEGALGELPGVGARLSAVIDELWRTGASPRLERMRRERPAGVVALAPVVGLKTSERLVAALGLGGLADLERACEER